MAPSVTQLARAAAPALLAFAAGRAAASAVEVCHNGSGECDEVGLLQQVSPVSRQGAGGAPSPLACKNGGYSVVNGRYCVCNPGWCGTTCETPEDAAPFRPHPHEQSNGEETCGLGFKVYPYEQAKLWGSAYEGWEGCDGQKQSPINIVTRKCHKTVTGGKLQTNYHGSGQPTDYVINNGHALEVDGQFGTLTLSFTKYYASNIHFHSPSEHTVNGRHADMEAHIVHLRGDQPKAVVAILFDIGKENECLSEVLSAPPPRAGCEKPVDSLDLTCFSHQLSGPWWSYTGSLTTPACTEGLAWQVMERRATISRAQLKAFRTRYLMNARPTQPLNDRKVTFHELK